MKKAFLKIIFLCFMALIFTNRILAQQDKSDLVFSGTLAHYIRSGEKSDIQGFYNYPVDPGVELLYQYQLSNTFFLSTGLSYQYGRIANWEGARNRFRFGEISLPIIGKLIFTHSNKTNLFAAMGFAYGKMVHVDWESPASWNEWLDVDKKYDEHYSDNDSFVDLMVGVGISFPVFHQNEFAITPYLKYRVKDNWMGFARDNTYYGVKISYQLNLKRNEKL